MVDSELYVIVELGAFNPRNNESLFHITFYLLIYLFFPTMVCVCVFYWAMCSKVKNIHGLILLLKDPFFSLLCIFSLSFISNTWGPSEGVQVTS
mgnify:CR=1 FL=1